MRSKRLIGTRGRRDGVERADDPVSAQRPPAAARGRPRSLVPSSPALHALDQHVDPVKAGLRLELLVLVPSPQHPEQPARFGQRLPPDPLDRDQRLARARQPPRGKARRSVPAWTTIRLSCGR